MSSDLLLVTVCIFALLLRRGIIRISLPERYGDRNQLNHQSRHLFQEICGVHTHRWRLLGREDTKLQVAQCFLDHTFVRGRNA